MKGFMTLAIASMLLANSARADNSQMQDKLLQLLEARNAVITMTLQRKLDALLDARIQEDARLREPGAIFELPAAAPEFSPAPGPELDDTRLVAAR